MRRSLAAISRGRDLDAVQGSRAEKIVPPYTYIARAYAAAMNPAPQPQASPDSLSSSLTVGAPIPPAQIAPATRPAILVFLPVDEWRATGGAANPGPAAFGGV